jgi:hypothetical protein
MWEPDYATVEELKQYISIPDDDTVDDTELAGKITAASTSINRHTHRQFGKVAAPELREYPVLYRGVFKVVLVDDLMDITGLTVMVGGVAVEPVYFDPRNAPQKGAPYTRIFLPVTTNGVAEVTALWGWDAVPTTVKEATLLQASRLFKRRDAPFGVAGSPDLGSELRLLAKVDPDVAVMLSKYVRRTGVA